MIEFADQQPSQLLGVSALGCRLAAKRRHFLFQRGQPLFLTPCMHRNKCNAEGRLFAPWGS